MTTIQIVNARKILNTDILKVLIEDLKHQTVHDALKHCEHERVEAWVSGYMTAIDDIMEILNKG